MGGHLPRPVVQKERDRQTDIERQREKEIERERERQTDKEREMSISSVEYLIRSENTHLLKFILRISCKFFCIYLRRNQYIGKCYSIIIPGTKQHEHYWMPDCSFVKPQPINSILRKKNVFLNISFLFWICFKSLSHLRSQFIVVFCSCEQHLHFFHALPKTLQSTFSCE